MKTRLLLLLLLVCPLALRAAETALLIDKSKSRVEIAVSATAGAFVARLENYEAILYADAAGARVTTAKFTFRFKDVKTGDAKRDEHMHEWQQTEQFPNGAFALAALTAAGEGKFTASGALTLHGATRDLTFPVAILREGTGFAIDGAVDIDTRDFGLKTIRKFLVMKVDPKVQVRFHLVAGPVAK